MGQKEEESVGQRVATKSSTNIDSDRLTDKERVGKREGHRKRKGEIEDRLWELCGIRKGKTVCVSEIAGEIGTHSEERNKSGEGVKEMHIN